MLDFAHAAIAAAERIRKAMAALSAAFARSANHPVTVAGFESRFYVRGAFAEEAGLAALVGYLMSASLDELADDEVMLAYMTTENRAALAAAAIRGFVDHNPGTNPDALAWHRWVGGQRLEVTRA